MEWVIYNLCLLLTISNYLLTSLFNLPGVYVEDLKEDELEQQIPETSKRKKILEGPENYQTCMY